MSDEPDHERTPDRDADSIEEDPTDSIDLEHTERVCVGVTRGETDLEIGPPRDYPDRADISVRPESDDEIGDRIVVSIDAMAGDHGTGHADVELTPAEAREIRDRLDETVRWLPEDAGVDTSDSETESEQK
ncbi:hypothetical protein RBH26_08235 [Natronolimnohabitans sp. A-GB9]|uniref:hypothetical protein n=1 Tax=Natronolimnohabitans sp. A-GB9 TaxID=3069757 RepID=UPI0027B182B3|nr:hypothetical protein [Natronolimnohabitans sp. A-GB9]MDQ2050474.1 hypothetical protein [Natronolimnohabitans sp. A-GB9]